MFNNGLGDSEFKNWSEEQRRSEIGKLVEGYRSGLPVGILCKMAETIAGDQSMARQYLMEFMSREERLAAVDKESGGMKSLVRSFLLTEA